MQTALSSPQGKTLIHVPKAAQKQSCLYCNLRHWFQIRIKKTALFNVRGKVKMGWKAAPHSWELELPVLLHAQEYLACTICSLAWQDKVLPHSCPFLHRKMVRCMPRGWAHLLLIKDQELSHHFDSQTIKWLLPLCYKTKMFKFYLDTQNLLAVYTNLLHLCPVFLQTKNSSSHRQNSLHAAH